MSTTRRDAKWTRFARTMLLGLVLALAIGVLAGAPQAAWLGFALAAVLGERSGGQGCRPRLARPSER